MPHFLHPTSLKLRNFKGIAELDIAFDESLTLLAGVNGAGKTSVIQALVVALSHAWSWTHPPPDSWPIFTPSEGVVRTGADGVEIVLELSRGEQSPLLFTFLLQEPFWERVLTPGEPRSPEPVQNPGGPTTPPPLVVYYQQGRGALEAHGAHFLISSKENRFSSLRTKLFSPSEFRAWFFQKEDDEERESRERQDLEYEDPELAAIRGLLRRLVGVTAIRSRKTSPDESDRTLLLEKEGVDVPVDSLSGGEQALLLLAADLARRLMLEFPNTPITEAPGIVCIDEIELHLHPAWQRKILKSLMEAFPSCQFIISTHSPQVIASVEARHVRLITPGENWVRKVSRPIASKGRDSNYVLEGILDVPARDDGVSRLFDEFDRLIDEGEIERAGLVLDELDRSVEGHSSEVAIRQAKWNRLRRTAT